MRMNHENEINTDAAAVGAASAASAAVSVITAVRKMVASEAAAEAAKAAVPRAAAFVLIQIPFSCFIQPPFVFYASLENWRQLRWSWNPLLGER